MSSTCDSHVEGERQSQRTDAGGQAAIIVGLLTAVATGVMFLYKKLAADGSATPTQQPETRDKHVTTDRGVSAGANRVASVTSMEEQHKDDAEFTIHEDSLRFARIRAAARQKNAADHKNLAAPGEASMNRASRSVEAVRKPYRH